MTAVGVTISSVSVSAISHRRRDLFDAALHVEVVFGDLVVLAVEDFPESANRVGDGNLFTLAAREHLGDAERLAEKALNLACAKHGELVVRRELVHAEDRDDVLEVLEALENFLDAARHLVVLAPDDLG